MAGTVLVREIQVHGHGHLVQRLKRRGLRAELLRWARPATVPPELLLPKATRGQTIVEGRGRSSPGRAQYGQTDPTCSPRRYEPLINCRPVGWGFPARSPGY